MHPDTFDVLRDNGVANTDYFAEKIADYYLAHAVSSPDEIDANARIVDETREAILGDSHPDYVVEELDEIIGELTRPTSTVYHKLPDGYSLCSVRVKRKAQTADGVTIVVNKVARFVSDDAGVVAAHRLDPLVQRLERSMERTRHTIDGDLDRIPALAAHTRGMLDRANRTMRAALPAPTDGTA